MTNVVLKEDEEFLRHYGVKGMKWGVRRQKETEGLSRKDTKKFHSRKLRERKGRADRLAKMAVGTGAATLGAVALSSITRSPQLRAGVNAVGNILGFTSVLTGAGALVSQAQANKSAKNVEKLKDK